MGFWKCFAASFPNNRRILRVNVLFENQKTKLGTKSALCLSGLIATFISLANIPTAFASAAVTSNDPPIDQDAEALCGKPVLADLKQHKVQSGETLESIAKKYELTTATLMGLNPSVRDGSVQVGQTIAIPSMDGLSYRFGNEETYKTVAKKFGLRADVLFEHNGCQNHPKVVFVPGAVWKPDPVALPNYIAKGDGIIMDTGGYPLPYPVPVTSVYGWRTNPVTGEWTFHSGIDLGAPMGTPVLAATSGRIEFAGWAGGYGNMVEIIQGSSGTRYAHLAAIYVSEGQNVARGQQIGIVGSTGRSTGPHLHFEILAPTADGWVAFDPAPYLNRLASVIRDIVTL
ncbi:M23 family metallopeptidase [Tumidithrix elongata RA019]|uniref:M23 family metallopeptidase n=2 Tax=Tumidithrix TaxID=3088355 RepID=A0AAW9Q6S5_9CYAN|nr:M23 family metallopeptidase [Tumidithrix elongata RA019]